MYKRKGLQYNVNNCNYCEDLNENKACDISDTSVYTNLPVKRNTSVHQVQTRMSLCNNVILDSVLPAIWNELSRVLFVFFICVG